MASSNQQANFDLMTICNALGNIQHKWFKIGVRLGIPRSKLQEFKKEEDPLSAVIDYWLRNATESASWTSLVAALKSRYVGEPGLAEEISKNYSQQEVFSEPAALVGDISQQEKAQAENVNGSCARQRSPSNPQCKLNPVKGEVKRILENDLKEIGTKYAVYVDCLREAVIEKGVSAVDLRSYLLSLPATSHSSENHNLFILSDKQTELEECTTVTDIFNLLKTKCAASFLNYDIFQCILKRYKISTDQEEFQYSEHLKQYFKQHTISEFVKKIPQLKLKPKHGAELTILYDKEATCSLSKVNDLKKLIANILNISTLILEIVDIEECCVIITFCMPAFVADALFTPNTAFTLQQEEKLRAASILWLKCNGYTFYFEKEKSSPSFKGELDMDVRLELERVLERNLKEIITKYAIFVDCLRSAIVKKKVSTEDLVSYLLSLSATQKGFESQKLTLLSDKKVKLQNCNSITDIFNVLVTECASFLNYDIFQSIQKHYCVSDDQEEFKYPEHVKAYLKKHTISEFTKINPLLNSKIGSEELIFKFDVEVTCRLAKLRDLQMVVADVLKINPLALRIMDIEEGCVIVKFLISVFLADAIFTSYTKFTPQQEKMLQAESVLWLKCNGYTFHFDNHSDEGLQRITCISTDASPVQFQCQAVQKKEVHAFCSEETRQHLFQTQSV